MPANYLMKGSPGGLARIDAIFGGHGYSNTFSNAPVPFGAFPSLHAGCATLEGLALSHFFPKSRPFIWAYVFVLYWSTMVSVERPLRAGQGLARASRARCQVPLSREPRLIRCRPALFITVPHSSLPHRPCGWR